ncbi:MAG: DoxX family protein [Alphaproteobacteria bacterium]|nr:DoxX family protein [Alphaproteobacteria bacterium]
MPTTETSSRPSPAPLIPALASVERALAPLAEPMLRAAAGLFLVPHGAQKLFGWFGGHGLEATGQAFATKLGLPPVLALVAGLIEFFGGLMLAVGLLTRPVAALVVGLMTVAAVQVHWPNGFFWSAGGVEYPLLWGIVALYFVLRGGGEVSVDRLIGREF